MRYKNKKRGFTLVELIVVIAIIGILAAISVPKYSAYKETANKKADEATAKLLTQATLMAIDNDSTLQTTINNLADAANSNIGTWSITDADVKTEVGSWASIEEYMGKAVKVNGKGTYPCTWTINVAKAGTIITIKAELTDSAAKVLATYSMEY